MTRALILAAGEMTRWNGYLSVPKHLIPIQGEPLIHRTQRMLAERGVEDIHVVCQAERTDYLLPGSHRVEPVWVARDWQQEQESSRHMWSREAPTLILYGDVYFTPELLDRITSDPADTWAVYARWEASEITGRAWGEMFGWVIPPREHGRIDTSRDAAIAAKQAGVTGRCLGWEVYRHAVGVDWHYHHCDGIHGVEHSDASDDFDYPHDYDEWVRRNPHLA
jgi:GTP:adenosylcobinamide-phosphate guanylyltransferase